MAFPMHGMWHLKPKCVQLLQLQFSHFHFDFLARDRSILCGRTRCTLSHACPIVCVSLGGFSCSTGGVAFAQILTHKVKNWLVGWLGLIWRSKLYFVKSLSLFLQIAKPFFLWRRQYIVKYFLKDFTVICNDTYSRGSRGCMSSLCNFMLATLESLRSEGADCDVHHRGTAPVCVLFTSHICRGPRMVGIFLTP